MAECQAKNCSKNDPHGSHGYCAKHWMQMKKHGKEHWIGSFETKDEAIKARQEAVVEFFGDHAPVELRGL